MGGIAILCSGQGRQDAGMFARLTEYPEAQAMLARIRIAGVLPPKVIAWLDGQGDDHDALFRNDIAQPLLCLYQLMLWEILRPQLPLVDLLAGYSLGELAAYGVGGILAPEQLIALATARGTLMSADEEEPQTMVAIIGLRQSRLLMLCRDCSAHIAIINGPDHFIVGLPLHTLAEFQAKCLASGAVMTVPLPVTVASHTPMQNHASVEFGSLLSAQECRLPAGEVLAGINAEKIYGRASMNEALTAQIRQTIDWYSCMSAISGYGCTVCLELGPGNSLSRMMQEAFPQIESRSLADFHDLHSVGKWLTKILARQN